MKNELLGIAPTRARALQALQRTSVHTALPEIAERVDRLCEVQDHFTYAIIQGPLYDALRTCRQTYASETDALVAVGSLDDRAAGLIGRFDSRARWDTFGIQRLARRHDPLEYLGYLMMSPQMTVLTLTCLTLTDIPGLHGIVTDPDRTPLQAAQALLAANPDAAAIISAQAFSGTPLPIQAGDETRFYRIGDNRHHSIRIGDSETGDIVHRGDLSPETADALVAALNATPDLGERFIAVCSQVQNRQERNRRRTEEPKLDDLFPDHGPSYEELVEKRESVIQEALGETVYAAHRKRLADEHEAWLDGGRGFEGSVTVYQAVNNRKSRRASR